MLWGGYGHKAWHRHNVDMAIQPTQLAAPGALAAPPGPALSGPQRALRKLGLNRPVDLALHLPLRYEDETRLSRLADGRDGEVLQIEAVVISSEVVLRPRRQLLVRVDDGSGQCTMRFFSFYPSHQKTLADGAKVRIRGEVRGGLWGWTMMHPTFRLADAPLPQALTPVYPSSAGLPQAYLRRAVAAGLQRADLTEIWPPDVWPSPAEWPTLRAALTCLHQPPVGAALSALEDRSHPAWQRLKAEELLAQQLAQQRARQARARLRAPALACVEGEVAQGLRAALPFALTGAQQRVVAEIGADLARPVPMHRLLQGDVGAGKTVVAALAAAQAIDAGWQCALMAPTEILAEQHFTKLVGWLEPTLAPLGLGVAWLTGGQGKKERKAALERIGAGQAALVIGTHAVIQSQVRFARLGLALIDEQHRFGVAQRLALRDKMEGQAQGLEPHLLMMTATPIPRTLAMSHYADLDVSTLDELPPGRTPVVTKLVGAHRRDEVIARIRTQLAEGRQVYWVCPLIEDSETLDLRHATAVHAELTEALQANAGQSHTVALLHSRLPAADKRAVMARFVAGETGVLVSTTVIEVGVDVPNASLMVIEHAERFGLSQLHQLRGRVGRGSAASACVLLYSPPEGGRLADTARERLRAMAETQDGFEIARRDLAIRGPGEFMGARQSGDPLLRFADLETDGALLEWAREAAPRLLQQSPQMAERHIERWMGGKSEFLKA